MSGATNTPMVLPACDLHGQMEHQTPGTPEQAYCGVWYRCSHCTNTVLLPSAAITKAAGSAA